MWCVRMRGMLTGLRCYVTAPLVRSLQLLLNVSVAMSLLKHGKFPGIVMTADANAARARFLALPSPLACSLSNRDLRAFQQDAHQHASQVCSGGRQEAHHRLPQLDVHGSARQQRERHRHRGDGAGAALRQTVHQIVAVQRSGTTLCVREEDSKIHVSFAHFTLQRCCCQGNGSAPPR